MVGRFYEVPLDHFCPKTIADVTCIIESATLFRLTGVVCKRCFTGLYGEVTEWPIVRPWKGRVLETAPRVRIPPSPPFWFKCELLIPDF